MPSLLSLLKFVTNGAWGTGIARPLTAAEADSNLFNVADALDDFISNLPEGVGIANIVVSGASVTFYMTDATTHGPFPLPFAQPRYRGAWAPSTAYTALDMIYAAGFGTFLVAIDHDSGLAFDPAASDTSGDFYVQIAADPNSTTTTLEWADATLTINPTHVAKYIRATNPSGLAVFLDAGVAVINSEISFRQTEAGVITFNTGTGVTINAPGGKSPITAGVGSTVTLKQVEPDVWDLIGGPLADVSA